MFLLFIGVWVLDGGHLIASEKSRKERFQKLSLVGTRVNPKIEMVADQEDEQIISMLAAKRFKLPRKFLDEEHASVPRKLRSAMKKRNTGSLSHSLQDPKKTKLHPRGRDSPKTDTLKKIKKQKRMDRAKSIRTNGSITKDEEEVVETLYALAGMFGSVADGRSGAADESSQDPTPTVNEAMESPKLQGIYEVSLREETAEAMNIKPKNEERADMLDSFEEAKQGKTHVLSTTEPSSENLPIGLIIDSRSTATNLEQQPKGPVLWPGLLRASRNSIPSWNEASLRSSGNYKSAESCYSTDKICKTTAGKAWRNKCTGHVYISHLIRSLQNPNSKEWLSLQDGREAASKQGMVNIGPGVAVLQNHCNGDVSTNLHQKRNSDGSSIAQMNCTEKQSFDFLSLSNRSGTTRFQVPYLQSYPQHHIPTIHPDHQIHYSTVSSQQLQLLPYHLGSSGRSSLQKGPTREHPQIASSQYGSRQVAQFPSWQNGRVESSASLHDLMTQYNSNHHQQQLQQYVSLPSSMAGPSLGKRQDHLVGLPSVVCEETAMRFHRGSSLSLQLLCNDRL